jgi:hypothetical protein
MVYGFVTGLHFLGVSFAFVYGATFAVATAACRHEIV